MTQDPSDLDRLLGPDRRQLPRSRGIALVVSLIGPAIIIEPIVLWPDDPPEIDRFAFGFAGVRTYISSGNVIFGADRRAPAKLTSLIEKAIAAEFGFPVKVLVRASESVASVAKAIPPSWKDDSTMRCYVMFLWGAIDEPAVLDLLTIKDDIDDVKYVPGAIIWRVDRANLTRSGMMKVTGSDLYRSMTIRNSNTVRKLAELMAQANQ